ncbi:MAG: hypothetical protein KDK23_05195 [Leptospiraceae bacterium]|nr:hypothetical protein [Leptospiraceae bacterium]
MNSVQDLYGPVPSLADSISDQSSPSSDAGPSDSKQDRRSGFPLKPGQKISRKKVETLLEQNRRMRDLLEAWPARKIMMGFEKDWNEKRERFLNHNEPVSLEPRPE